MYSVIDLEVLLPYDLTSYTNYYKVDHIYYMFAEVSVTSASHTDGGGIY